MQPIYLERHDPTQNLHRFYSLQVARGVFWDWSLIREWGRVGSSGTVRSDWFDTEDEAIIAAQKLYKIKQKKGYLGK